ncbi:cell envelope integrity protein CreD [Pseudomonas hefeiensis]|uniref:Cell envelope integrity protein CreD n=1 Tax=Pseudomonas hefeiensis TaxID=2738125 RepID=A0ABY9G9L1_9PSED|nr:MULTISPECIES: cell envelope integrity protein CreD [unclassified Pseudomonas]WLH12319.1 cell envelope integrity protein CreD [Pseudomonas sp. FP205]WLH95372.1 cell envelope integrity protein CreD [Pseudomonas sp. FP53]WLI39659.1 cell envelope integrity protein CreD [Pseudomonas sp. FP821]
MNRSLAIKLGMIALLILLLMIPLLMINGLIDERQELRDGVLQDIARSSSHSQQLIGPMIVVPFRKDVRVWNTNEKTGVRFLETVEQSGELYFLPEQLDIDGQIRTETRARGIYEARLFHADNRIDGHFKVPERFGVAAKDFADYRFDEPYLSVGISDIRGIENALTLTFNQQTVDFLPGSRIGWLGQGVHVPLPMVTAQGSIELTFGFDLRLQGTGQLQILPVGKSTQVHLSADWPHPSFIGNYLPTQRDINEQGFSADWQTSFFSTNLLETLQACEPSDGCEAFRSRAFGVSFIDPVDQYLKSDRAIKYALLFIALTFAGFFLFEVLKTLAVHPVQYALVGVALAFFYLLLLSLSEHIGFALAYLVSASACVLLIGFYVCHVLRSVSHGLGFSAGLAGLYGLLYGLLSAEDYALLMGSLLLFGLLGVFMILTRKLDWYRVGAKPAAAMTFDLGEVK